MVQTLFKSLFAGLLISLGCIAFLSSDNKLVGSVLFSIGLLTIIHFKQYLFTGLLCNFQVYNKFSDNIKNILKLLYVYIGNIIGVSIGSTFLHYSRLYYMDKINSIIGIKINDSFISLFILGILCESCIFIAVKRISCIFQYIFQKFLSYFRNNFINPWIRW